MGEEVWPVVEIVTKFHDHDVRHVAGLQPFGNRDLEVSAAVRIREPVPGLHQGDGYRFLRDLPKLYCLVRLRVEEPDDVMDTGRRPG